MKICSLLPSATEILYALGLADEVVAVTHECDYPAGAKVKPRITRSAINQGESSATIDRLVGQQLDNTGSLYELDLEALDRLKPDLILTQRLCSVCAVSYDYVAEAARKLSRPPQVVNLEPNSIDDILENIILVGRLTHREVQASEVVKDLENRIEGVEERTRRLGYRPRVFCMEWVDPPYCGGHWIPELVDLAGGYDGLGRKGLPSVRIEWGRVVVYSPEVIVVMCCGFDLHRTLEETPRLVEYEGWSQLPAVRRGAVYAVDGSAYFSRPGPRIVDSLEILASILHPELFPSSSRSNTVVKVNTNQYIST